MDRKPHGFYQVFVYYLLILVIKTVSLTATTWTTAICFRLTLPGFDLLTAAFKWAIYTAQMDDLNITYMYEAKAKLMYTHYI